MDKDRFFEAVGIGFIVSLVLSLFLWGCWWGGVGLWQMGEKCEGYAAMLPPPEISRRPRVVVSTVVTQYMPAMWRVVQTRDGKYHTEFAQWHKAGEDSSLTLKQLLRIRDELNATPEAALRPPDGNIPLTNGVSLDVRNLMREMSNIVNWVPPYRILP